MISSSVSLLLVGDELLDGRSVDTNSHWLLARLAELGAVVAGVEVVGDRLDDVVAAIGRAAARSGTVILTGGLGPTEDDRTRDALALFADDELHRDDDVLEQIRQRFLARGKEMPPGNERQATRPGSASFIPNEVGTAPGILLERDGVLLLALPGVPREMHVMWQAEVAARVRERIGSGRAFTQRLRLARAGESAIAAKVGDWMRGHGALDLAYCVNDWGVDVLLRGDDAMELVTAAQALSRHLAPRVYNVGDAGMPELLLEQLRRRRATVAVAESCTGGLVAAALSDVPGSSDVLRGGLVAYANELKISELAVPRTMLEEHGAVSEPVVLQMAHGARQRYGADYALATTGVAGPGGGSESKPVGSVWIAVAGPDGEIAELLRLGNDRLSNRRWSVAAVLDLLRMQLGDGRLDP